MLSKYLKKALDGYLLCLKFLESSNHGEPGWLAPSGGGGTWWREQGLDRLALLIPGETSLAEVYEIWDGERKQGREFPEIKTQRGRAVTSSSKREETAIN